ncbi:hypothetical protein EDD17DRAFT_308806 [Pisolithus thermaeus]|nr:hypothetical protein EDD17DRAFT_308806 [Pisolithus thermaeus]
MPHSAVGTLFSGLLQGALRENFGAEAGGDSCMCLHNTGRTIQPRLVAAVLILSIALSGFVVFPDVPAATKALYQLKRCRISSPIVSAHPSANPTGTTLSCEMLKYNRPGAYRTSKKYCTPEKVGYLNGNRIFPKAVSV